MMMRCPSCRNDELTEAFTTYFSDTDGLYVIIENVPCRKCMHCGEIFFSASVMAKIDRIIASIRSIASKISVVDYKQAA